jgi:hypothetical protein
MTKDEKNKKVLQEINFDDFEGFKSWETSTDTVTVTANEIEFDTVTTSLNTDSGETFTLSGVDYSLQSSYSTDTITVNGESLNTDSLTTITLNEKQLDLFNDNVGVTITTNLDDIDT